MGSGSPRRGVQQAPSVRSDTILMMNNTLVRWRGTAASQPGDVTMRCCFGDYYLFSCRPTFSVLFVNDCNSLPFYKEAANIYNV